MSAHGRPHAPRRSFLSLEVLLSCNLFHSKYPDMNTHLAVMLELQVFTPISRRWLDEANRIWSETRVAFIAARIKMDGTRKAFTIFLDFRFLHPCNSLLAVYNNPLDAIVAEFVNQCVTQLISLYFRRPQTTPNVSH
jgi:hypothetical protein